MGSATHVYGDSSPFKKRFLIPFLLIRWGAMAGNYIYHGLAIVILARRKDDIDVVRDGFNFNDSIGNGGMIALVSLGFVILTVLGASDLFLVFQRARKMLSPKLFMIASAVQTVLALALIIVAVAGPRSAGLISLEVIALICFVALSAYGFIIFGREKKGDLLMLPKGSQPPVAPINYSGAPAAAGPGGYYNNPYPQQPQQWGPPPAAGAGPMPPMDQQPRGEQNYGAPPTYAGNPAFDNHDPDRKSNDESRYN